MYGKNKPIGKVRIVGKAKPRHENSVITITVSPAVGANGKAHGYVVTRSPKAGNATERVFGLYREGRLSWVSMLKGATWFDEYKSALLSMNSNAQNGENMSIKAINVVDVKGEISAKVAGDGGKAS